MPTLTDGRMMTSRQKQKGSRFERAIADYLNDAGFATERTRVGWADDRGDIHGIHNFTIECKNQARMDIAGWVDEMQVECVNNDTVLGVVIHKRKGKGDPGESYATMPLWMLVLLLRRAGFK